MNDPFSITYAVIAAVVVALCIYAWGFKFYRRHQKMRTLSAVVLEKRVLAHEEYLEEKGRMGTKTEYVIAFDTPKGKKTLYVAQDAFEAVAVGETGTLSYQGGKVIDFVTDREETHK